MLYINNLLFLILKSQLLDENLKHTFLFLLVDNAYNPFKWSTFDKGSSINIVNQSRLSYYNSDGPFNIIRTTEPISMASASFYFEIKIVDSGVNGAIGIGITQSDPSTRSGAMPGWGYFSTDIGYHGDDGKIFHTNPNAKSKPSSAWLYYLLLH